VAQAMFEDEKNLESILFEIPLELDIYDGR
jgi:hypothetical protein